MTEFSNDWKSTERPLRVDVPLGFNPAVFLSEREVLDIGGTPGATAIYNARCAMNAYGDCIASLRDSYREIIAASSNVTKYHDHTGFRQKSLAGIEMRTNPDTGLEAPAIRIPDELLPHYAAAVKIAVDKAADEHQRNLNHVEAVMEKLDAQVLSDLKPATSPDAIALAQEVRNKLAGMKPREAYLAVERAIDAGDKLTVSAVIFAPSLLVNNITPTELAKLRQTAEAKFSTAYRQSAAVHKIHEKLMAAVPQFVDLADRLTPKPRMTKPKPAVNDVLNRLKGIAQ
jgi:hypothetical protein